MPVLDLADLLAERGRPAEAAPHLHEARSIFVDLSATPWLERTERSLAVAATA
jgi:hypothetical protein